MTNEETLQALNATYSQFKDTETKAGKKSDVLKYANNAVISLFPNVKDNNGDVWHALEQKQAIKQFYIDYVTADYSKEKSIDLETAQKDVETALHDFFNKIKGNPNAGGKNAFNQYLQEISDHDTTNDFQCGLLPANSTMKALNFPKATLNIIAGRPSAGKTTALASIAMYAMRHTKKNVLFVTSEETTNQLITRFIKNQFCDNCLNNGNGTMLLHDYGKTYINDTFKDIINKDRKNPALFETGNKDTFTNEVLKATKDVENFITCGRLQLFDLDKTTSFEELKDRLQELERHTIVIIDYIQNLPYAPNGTPHNDRLESLRQQIFAINAIVKANELIGIAGAQFNREGANEHNPESLELNKLGDSGEIERKAHIAIGLGRKIYDDNTKKYFYRVMKDREGDISAHFEIADYYAYSYLQAKTNKNELVKFTTSNTSKAGAGTGKPKKDKDNEPATTSTPTTFAGLLNNKQQAW